MGKAIKSVAKAVGKVAGVAGAVASGDPFAIAASAASLFSGVDAVKSGNAGGGVSAAQADPFASARPVYGAALNELLMPNVTTQLDKWKANQKQILADQYGLNLKPQDVTSTKDTPLSAYANNAFGWNSLYPGVNGNGYWPGGGPVYPNGMYPYGQPGRNLNSYNLPAGAQVVDVNGVPMVRTTSTTKGVAPDTKQIDELIAQMTPGMKAKLQNEAVTSTVMNTPGYMAGLDAGNAGLARNLAATGQTASGNEQVAFNKYNTDYFKTAFQDLYGKYSQLSGATQQPYAAAGALNQAAQMNTSATNSGWSAIQQGIAGLGNIYNAATSGSSGNSSIYTPTIPTGSGADINNNGTGIGVGVNPSISNWATS